MTTSRATLCSISPAGQPNLVLTKEHDGDFTQGQQGAAYRLRVANSGQAPSAGLVTVTDNLPAGLTPTSASGSGWACAIASQTVTCTRSDALAPGGAFPLIVILVNVAANATDVVNVATLERRRRPDDGRQHHRPTRRTSSRGRPI